MRKLRYSKK